MSNYIPSGYPKLLGDDAPKVAETPLLDRPIVKTAATAAGVFHGYKRTGSVLWALLYGVVARTSPVITGAVMAAQGFARPKGS